MKKLSKNILKKISLISIILLVLVVPIFSEDMVPKKQFDEVLNQLIISNEQLLKAQEFNTELQEALVTQEENFSAKLIEKDVINKELSSENTALNEKLITSENEKEEILAQLIIANDTIIKLKKDNSDMAIALKSSNDGLSDSNNLLTKDIKFSLGGNATIINGSVGFGVDFSYLVFKNMSIDIGIGYSYPINITPRVGISILW